MNLRLAIIFCIVVFTARANGEDLTIKEKFQIFSRRARSSLKSHGKETKLDIRTDSWYNLDKAPSGFQEEFIKAYANKLKAKGLDYKDESKEAEEAAFHALDEQLKLFIQNRQDTLMGIKYIDLLKKKVKSISKNNDVLKFFGVYNSLNEKRTSKPMIDEIAKMKGLYEVSDDGAITLILFEKFADGKIKKDYPAGPSGGISSWFAAGASGEDLTTEEKFKIFSRRARSSLKTYSQETKLDIQADSWHNLDKAPNPFQEEFVEAYAKKLKAKGLDYTDESKEAEKAAFYTLDEQLKFFIQNRQDTLMEIKYIDLLKKKVKSISKNSDVLKLFGVYNSLNEKRTSKPMIDEIAKKKELYEVDDDGAITLILFEKFADGKIKKNYPAASSAGTSNSEK